MANTSIYTPPTYRRGQTPVSTCQFPTQSPRYCPPNCLFIRSRQITFSFVCACDVCACVYEGERWYLWPMSQITKTILAATSTVRSSPWCVNLFSRVASGERARPISSSLESQTLYFFDTRGRILALKACLRTLCWRLKCERFL